MEQYKSQPSKANGDSGVTRKNIYNPFFTKPDCPFTVPDIEGIFTEPYYQLFRQTLLANEMVNAREYNASDYLHIHAIPIDNRDLKEVNTASGKLDGSNLEQTWKGLLKNPSKYLAVDPKELLKPAKSCRDTISWLTYLEKRYW